jgi:hypothetical protein
MVDRLTSEEEAYFRDLGIMVTIMVTWILEVCEMMFVWFRTITSSGSVQAENFLT